MACPEPSRAKKEKVEVAGAALLPQIARGRSYRWADRCSPQFLPPQDGWIQRLGVETKIKGRDKTRGGSLRLTWSGWCSLPALGLALPQSQTQSDQRDGLGAQLNRTGLEPKRPLPGRG